MLAFRKTIDFPIPNRMNSSDQVTPIEFYKNSIFKKLLYSGWIILGFYSIYYGNVEGAEFLFWTVFSGAVIFFPFTLWLEYRCYKIASRLLFIFSTNAFIYLTSLGLSHKTGSQYYFLPIAMIAFMIFDSSQKKLIYLSTAFTFAVWSLIHLVGPIPQVSTFVTLSLPLENIKITDFIGAFAVMVMGLIFFNRTNRQLTELLEHNSRLKIQKEKLLSQQLRAAQKIAQLAPWEFSMISGFEIWDQENYENFGILDAKSQSLFWKKFTEQLRNWITQKHQGIFFQESFQFESPNGEHKSFEVLGKPIFNDANELIKVVGTCRDISQKVLSDRLVESQRLQLIQASKLASLGEMSAGIAHEINNPLTVIIANIPLLNRFRDQSEKFDSKVESIRKSAARIEKIVKGLQKFSRTTDGNTPVIASLREIVFESLVLTETKARQNEVVVKEECSDDLRIKCDPVEIEQVLINLINNSIDAVKGQSERWIQIKSFSVSDEVILQIIDSGNGISQEVAQKIFNPFFTTKAVGEGTGLGLSISKGILDQHQATIELNQSFKNTCFEIRFPAAVTKKSNIRDAA